MEDNAQIQELIKQRRTALIEMVNAAYRLRDSLDYRLGFSMAMDFTAKCLQYPDLMDELLELTKNWDGKENKQP